ncbi:MAG: carboxymuconolactone decarboxylase family protein [Anaerolineales bacterium]|nr:carboxymuconolactone decarboxylase family protein [Anaerolineales bacterium]
MERARLLAELLELVDRDAQAAERVISILRERHGDLGFLMRTLSRRPGVFVPQALRGVQLYDAPHALDPKTAELAAVAAAAALMCEHCLQAHMSAARSKGASLDEIFDVLLIAGSIAESSTLAVALRKFRQLEGKRADGAEPDA